MTAIAVTREPDDDERWDVLTGAWLLLEEQPPQVQVQHQRGKLQQIDDVRSLKMVLCWCHDQHVEAVIS